MKKLLFCLLALAAVLAAEAQIPEGYYHGINGKAGASLKDALKVAINDHTVFSYNALWEAYEVTDVVEGTNDQVLEMYSNNEIHYTTRGTLINREHTVPQSWWGKGSRLNAYTDLFNVLPAEAKANNAKSNNPLGIVTGKVSFDNGVTKIGQADNAGGSTSVFEPADKYKGDFARIYFYVATCYANDSLWTESSYAIAAEEFPTLKPWIVDMLLKWSREDPVDEQELKRNEAVFYMQKNRNPFVDYSDLPEYIWGSKQTDAFNLSEHQANVAKGGYDFKFKAARPEFSAIYGTSAETAQALPEGTEITVKCGNSGPTAALYVSENDGEYKEYRAYSEFGVAEAKFVVERDLKLMAYGTKEERDAPSDVMTAYYKVADHSGYLLFDDFSDVSSGTNTSTSGQSDWKGNANFPNVTKAYTAGGAIKLGTSSLTGELVSRELDFDGGTVTVEIDVKGWTKVEGQLCLTMTGAEMQSKSYTATISDDFETLTYTFENVSQTPVLTIATSAKRAFIDNVKVYAGASSIHSAASKSSDISAAAYYNVLSVDGRRVSTSPSGLPRGLYIVNGKKMAVR